MNRNKRGRFWITRDFIEQYPSEVLSLFYTLKIIPVRAEYYYDTGLVEYIAISENFEEISDTISTPDYQVIGRHVKIDDTHIETYYRLEKMTDATGWSKSITFTESA